MLPVAAILSQLGGTFLKALRRIVIPLLFLVAIVYFKGFSWLIIPAVLAQFGVFTLPFTFKGNGIPEHWFNWIWVFIWGVLICAPAMFLNLAVWPAVLVCGLFLGLICALSNIAIVAKWFPWKLCEAFIGICPAICLCFATSL